MKSSQVNMVAPNFSMSRKYTEQASLNKMYCAKALFHLFFLQVTVFGYTLFTFQMHLSVPFNILIAVLMSLSLYKRGIYEISAI